MARKITVVITGDKRLNKKLHRLTTKQQKSAFRKAARPAIKPVMQQARTNAAKSSDTGKLARTIKVRSQKRSRSTIGIRVTTRSEDFSGSYYAAFQEYGWKAGANRRQIKGTGSIKDAAESKKASVLRDYSNRLKTEIERSAKK